MRVLPARTLLFVITLTVASATGLLVAAGAGAANLVPNPGFQLGTITPTSWHAFNSFTILRDTATPTHDDGSNTASLFASGVSVGSNPGAFSDCTTGVTPLTHANVSFWYLTSSVVANGIGMEVDYYSDTNCQNLISGGLIEVTPTVGGWHKEQDTSFMSPANTQAAKFSVFITCNFCGMLLTANFDDLVYEQSPLAVTLSSFRAVRSHRGVALRWRTGTEADTLGFNVFRQHGVKRVRVNRRLLPALGGLGGSSYSFVDRRAPRHRAVRYWLQDVDTDGVRAWHGPVRVAAG